MSRTYIYFLSSNLYVINYNNKSVCQNPDKQSEEQKKKRNLKYTQTLQPQKHQESNRVELP